MTAEMIRDIQDAVYQCSTVDNLEFVKCMRERGDTCKEIGQQMRGVAHGDWPETFNGWVGYFFCEASSRIHRQEMSEEPWHLGELPD